MFKKKKEEGFLSMEKLESTRQQVDGLRNEIRQSLYPEKKQVRGLTLKEELDNLHAQIQEAGKVKVPSRGEVFGPSGKPIGICFKCQKMFQIDQLQKYYTNPQNCFWLCAKCAFKKRMREKFSSRL